MEDGRADPGSRTRSTRADRPRRVAGVRESRVPFRLRPLQTLLNAHRFASVLSLIRRNAVAPPPRTHRHRAVDRLAFVRRITPVRAGNLEPPRPVRVNFATDRQSIMACGKDRSALRIVLGTSKSPTTCLASVQRMVSNRQEVRPKQQTAWPAASQTQIPLSA